MKILLCTPQKVTQYLGISRVLIELQKALIMKGHQVDLLGPQEIGLDKGSYVGGYSFEQMKIYQEALRKYLIKHASEYDVVDYDHEYLPFDRSDFPSKTLFVTRSVLLIQHLEYINVPQRKNLRSYIGEILYSKNRQQLKDFRIQSGNKTVMNADLINLPNKEDREYLIKKGISADKITVIPFGFSDERIMEFNMTSKELPETPTLCFLGTYDYRKGALSIPKVFQKVVSEIPNAKLKLVGAKGMFQTEKEILSFFPRKLRKNIEIILSFKREEVGNYLKDCSVGIFPTYIEGFCFGILEMMLAHMPVVTFNSPGSTMMVQERLLVSPGDDKKMAQKVISLLKSPEKLEEERVFANKVAKSYTWDLVADMTINSYDIACRSRSQ